MKLLALVFGFAVVGCAGLSPAQLKGAEAGAELACAVLTRTTAPEAASLCVYADEFVIAINDLAIELGQAARAEAVPLTTDAVRARLFDKVLARRRWAEQVKSNEASRAIMARKAAPACAEDVK